MNSEYVHSKITLWSVFMNSLTSGQAFNIGIACDYVTALYQVISWGSSKQQRWHNYKQLSSEEASAIWATFTMFITIWITVLRNEVRDRLLLAICAMFWAVRGSNPGGRRDFPLPSCPDLGPAQPPLKWVTVLCSGGGGVKRSGRGFDNPSQSNDEVKERVVIHLYSPPL